MVAVYGGTLIWCPLIPLPAEVKLSDPSKSFGTIIFICLGRRPYPYLQPIRSCNHFVLHCSAGAGAASSSVAIAYLRSIIQVLRRVPDQAVPTSPSENENPSHAVRRQLLQQRS